MDQCMHLVQNDVSKFNSNYEIIIWKWIVVLWNVFVNNKSKIIIISLFLMIFTISSHILSKYKHKNEISIAKETLCSLSIGISKTISSLLHINPMISIIDMDTDLTVSAANIRTQDNNLFASTNTRCVSGVVHNEDEELTLMKVSHNSIKYRLQKLVNRAIKKTVKQINVMWFWVYLIFVFFVVDCF
eukprot:97880_1